MADELPPLQWTIKLSDRQAAALEPTNANLHIELLTSAAERRLSSHFT